jgi:hypothetical protein
MQVDPALGRQGHHLRHVPVDVPADGIHRLARSGQQADAVIVPDVAAV